MTAAVAEFAPEDTPRRKLLQIISIVLVIEGLTSLFLYSKAGLWVGILSLILGVLLLLLLFPKGKGIEKVSEEAPGIRLLDFFVKVVGGEYVVMALGAFIIASVLLFNMYVSERQELGDLDTLSILFGGMLLVFPFIIGKFKVEASFSVLFLAFVMVLLVIPQVFSSGSDDGTTSIGNWYVHYMLAAPFSAALHLLGIDSSSSGSYVTLQFHDGTYHTLGISAYCAGLYSFSIFLSAFFAFVLVFERLRTRTIALVMAIGLLVAYIGNLLRMTIIGVVGYYKGIDALLWAHENVGWIIFLSWSAVFWYVLLNYVSVDKKEEPKKAEVN